MKRAETTIYRARQRRKQTLETQQKKEQQLRDAEAALAQAKARQAENVPGTVEPLKQWTRGLFEDRHLLAHAVWMATHTLEDASEDILAAFIDGIIQHGDIIMSDFDIVLTGRDAFPTCPTHVAIQRQSLPLPDAWTPVSSALDDSRVWKSPMHRSGFMFNSHIAPCVDRGALLVTFLRVVLHRQTTPDARRRVLRHLYNVCRRLDVPASVTHALKRRLDIPDNQTPMLMAGCLDPTPTQNLVTRIVTAPWRLNMESPIDAKMWERLEDARRHPAPWDAPWAGTDSDVLVHVLKRMGGVCAPPPIPVCVTVCVTKTGETKTVLDTVHVRRAVLETALMCAESSKTTSRLLQEPTRHAAYQTLLCGPDALALGVGLWKPIGTCPTIVDPGRGMRNLLFPHLLFDVWSHYNSLTPRKCTGGPLAALLTLFFTLKLRIMESCPVLADVVSFSVLALLAHRGDRSTEKVKTAVVRHIECMGRLCASDLEVSRLVNHVVDASQSQMRPNAVVSKLFANADAVVEVWQVRAKGPIGDAAEAVTAAQAAIDMMWVSYNASVSVGGDGHVGVAVTGTDAEASRLVHDVIAQSRAVNGLMFRALVHPTVKITPTFTTAAFNWVSDDNNHVAAAAKWLVWMTIGTEVPLCIDAAKSLPGLLHRSGGLQAMWERDGGDATLRRVLQSITATTTTVLHRRPPTTHRVDTIPTCAPMIASMRRRVDACAISSLDVGLDDTDGVVDLIELLRVVEFLRGAKDYSAALPTALRDAATVWPIDPKRVTAGEYSPLVMTIDTSRCPPSGDCLRLVTPSSFVCLPDGEALRATSDGCRMDDIGLPPPLFSATDDIQYMLRRVYA